MATIQTKWASCADQTGGWFRLSGRGIQTKRAGLTRSLELALVVYPAARVEVSCLDGVFGRSVPSAPGGGKALQADDRRGPSRRHTGAEVALCGNPVIANPA